MPASACAVAPAAAVPSYCRMATALPDTVFALKWRITSRAYTVFRSYTVSS
jgi:hypothetical protein